MTSFKCVNFAFDQFSLFCLSYEILMRAAAQNFRQRAKIQTLDLQVPHNFCRMDACFNSGSHDRHWRIQGRS